MSGPTYLVCETQAALPACDTVPGTVVAGCERCGRGVWVVGENLSLPAVVVVCVPCGLELAGGAAFVPVEATK